jgi:glycerate dehydrogenase
MKIVVLDGYTLNPGDNPWTDLEKMGDLTVHDRTRKEDFLERTRSADILLTNKTPITAQQIGQLPNLKFISVLATGYNIVDIAAARERRIPVANVPIYGTDAVAQHVKALILEHTNHVGEYARSVADGEWVKSPDFCYIKKPLLELRDFSLGIIGFGRIGQRVAELGHAFGMKILYANRSKKEGISLPAQHVLMDRLFGESDIISLHCPQGPENFQFVNQELLNRMKPTAFLINTARGTLIHEADLAQALRDHKLAGAALDVLSKEPPDWANPLLQAPNCTITPHIAWSSLPARKRLMRTTVENVQAFLQGIPRYINQAA